MDTDIKSFNLNLQTIRDRPGMFLSPVSVSALWHFILGFGLGRSSVSPEAQNPFALPSDFHDWVAYRLHFLGSTTGWHNMIVNRFGDGPNALDRFFSLLDEYHSRVPRIVATLSGCDKTYTELFMGKKRTRSFPPTVVLTAYNVEDPGLFVSAEGSDHFPGQGYCPSLQSFESIFGPCGGKLTVFDQAAFAHWAHQPPFNETPST